MKLMMHVNGQPHAVETTPDSMLVDVLRGQLGLLGVKVGCGEGECGACTVLLDGRPVASCVTPAIKAQGRDVVTIEGLAGPEDDLDLVQKAFLAEGAVQCGFCTPGMVLAAKALLAAKPDPTTEEIRAAFTGHLCRCTGYNAIERAVRRAADALSQGHEIELDVGEDANVVGRAVVRKDGPDKVTGRHRFGADRGRPGELQAAAVWSAHPYAELLSLDTSAALAVEGVAAVLTAEDVPGQNAHGVIIPNQPVFVAPGERVRSISDVLALVLAETEEIARAAAALVKAEYRALEGVFTPHEALAPGAPILHPPRPGDEPSNVMYGTHVEKGDVEAAMGQADVVLEGQYRTPFIEHAYLEPEAGTADVDDGVVTVYMASQALAFHQRGVAAVLGVPPEQVRLVHVSPGGGFGARNDLSLHPYLALAAYHSQRPVKMVLTRAESLRFHTKRHAMEHTVRIGANRDGRIVALACDILADTGAYSSAGIPVLDQATLFATGPYDIDNVRIKGLAVYTNNVACGAMRGFGIPQSAFAVESLLDELAATMEISPFELRRINGLRVGSTTATGQRLQASVPYLETVDAVEEALAAALKELPPPASGHKRGVGVASCYKNVGLGLGMPEPTGVGIDLTGEGRILVRFGGAELGQGADTVLAQMAAQALGVPYTLIDVLGCDTARTPDGGITSASRTTFMSGNAALEAASLFLEKLRAELPGEAAFTQESLASLAQRGPITVEHTYHPPPTYSLEATGDEESVKFVSFSYATQAAIADVDEASGEVHVRRIIAAHDVGRTINPHGARGQIEGSCLMGLGYAISEEFILNRGTLATDTLAKVGIPFMHDTPPVDVLLLEDPEPLGPYGAKGIAEAAAIPTAPAILNALYRATGVRIRQLPATPDRVILQQRSDAIHS
jgi:aldehyde oxidoreductase